MHQQKAAQINLKNFSSAWIYLETQRFVVALIISIALHTAIIVMTVIPHSVSFNAVNPVLHVKIITQPSTPALNDPSTTTEKKANSQKENPLPQEKRVYLTPDKLDIQPEVLQPIVPDYPLDAFTAGMSAKVRLKVYIDEKGSVINVETLEPQENNVFVTMAIKAMRQARFTPGQIKGKPVPTVLTPIVEFQRY